VQEPTKWVRKEAKMARARNIKPAFFKNEHLLNLSYAARLLFIGLWTLADREGRLEDRPKRIKLDLFPDDEIDVDSLLSELHHSEGDFIKRYEISGKRCIQIIKFLKHQKPHKKEAESELPPLPIIEIKKAEERHDPAEKKNGLPEIGSTEPEIFQASNDLFSASRAESLLLNDECGIPTTSSNEKPISNGGGRGQFFKIENRGIETTEDEWLFRCFREQRMNKQKNLMGCETLQSMLSLFPTIYEAYRRWLMQSIDIRMAAYAYVSVEVQADDPFKYALKAAENSNSWNDKFQNYLKATKQSVEEGDYTVKING
jgi:hypothetical protein